MTREERVKKLRCLITCMKCEVSGKVCDNNCPIQYDAGNMGKIIENLEEIAKALEQEPNKSEIPTGSTTKNDLGVDCISRQAVLDLINADWKYENLEIEINNLPSVTPQEPRKGHWILRNSFLEPKCSECNYESERYNFCPNCGAKMVEPQESEDKG